MIESFINTLIKYHNAFQNLQDKRRADSGHRSLADHLGATYIDDILHYPGRLSGEILRCISSIYCKFSNHALPAEGLSLSSTSSLSSSSTFSPRDVSSSWSPQFSEEAKCNSELEGLKDENTVTAYASAIEVSNLNLDDDSFKYVATMLQRFRYSTLNLLKPYTLSAKMNIIYSL